MARVPPMPPRHTEVGMSQVPGVALGPATLGDSQATTPPLLSYFRFLYRRRLRIQKKTYFLGFLPCFLFLLPLPPALPFGACSRVWSSKDFDFSYCRRNAFACALVLS